MKTCTNTRTKMIKKKERKKERQKRKIYDTCNSWEDEGFSY